VHEWDDMAVVARVARPHGLRGEVVLNAETDFAAERFCPGAVLHVGRDGRVETLRVRSAWFQRGRPVVAFDGMDSIEAVEGLAGLELRVPLEGLAPLPEGCYYRHDLVGCRVETVEGAEVGVVVRVEGELEASRLVVEREGEQILVPMVDAICRAVDVGQRRIAIAAPDGLLELNVTRKSRARQAGGRT
jgi:16S rRNA processing protein RimM